MPHKEIIKRSSGASAWVRPPRGRARKPRFKSYQTRRTGYQERRSDFQWLIRRHLVCTFLVCRLFGFEIAVWSCTNGLASRPQDGSARLACDLHAHRHAVDMKKTSPRQGKKAAPIGLEASVEVVLVAP